jgi:glc operon protein GlcG
MTLPVAESDLRTGPESERRPVRAEAWLIALLCVVALAALARALPSVSYYSAEQVQAAFDKGAVLFDGKGTNYMVHASRREGPGQAEVHEEDTDVIYVLGGSATFVTGGSVVEPRTTAPGEIRGPSIEDGESRRIAKGDVIIVPNGTPHWFKEVDGPVIYYVVKVR